MCHESYGLRGRRRIIAKIAGIARIAKSNGDLLYENALSEAAQHLGVNSLPWAQMVSKCDILVGMFRTRLGTSMCAAESGTVEEISQFVAAGKPALLYFSSRRQISNHIDEAHETLSVPDTRSILERG